MSELFVSVSPHIRSPRTTQTIMRDVLIALCPALIASCVIFGVRALLVTVVCMAASVLFEFLYQKGTKQPITISDCSAAVTGMILWLNTGLLPNGGMKVAFSTDVLLWARLLHDIFFALTTIVGIAHIYLGAGIFEPYKGTARIMFGDGKVSESDALYHWGYWANEELPSGRNVTVENDKK